MVGMLLACNVKCRTKWLGDLFVHRPPMDSWKNSPPTYRSIDLRSDNAESESNPGSFSERKILSHLPVRVCLYRIYT